MDRSQNETEVLVTKKSRTGTTLWIDLPQGLTRDPLARQVGYGEKNACRPGPARERIL